MNFVIGLIVIVIVGLILLKIDPAGMEGVAHGGNCENHQSTSSEIAE